MRLQHMMSRNGLSKLRLLALCTCFVFFISQTGRITASDVDFAESKTEWSAEDGKISAFAKKNARPYMEDRFFIKDNIDGSGISIFAVFDGHGGKDVAEYANDHLIKNIIKKITDLKAQLPNVQPSQTTANTADDEPKYFRNSGGKITIAYNQVLKNTILEMDSEIKTQLKELANYTGTTVLIGIIDGKELTIANSGDSRAVCFNTNKIATRLSIDHKPNLQSEEERILARNGKIEKAIDDSYRVLNDDASVSLAVSRALGDFAWKIENRELVTALPFITSMSTEGLKFIILASDGLWDVFEDQAAGEYIDGIVKNTGRGTKEIVNEAINKHSEDNITAIVVEIKNG